MAVRSELSNTSDGDVLTISVTGRFDIDSYKDFTQAYKERPETISKYVIDMSDLEYMDSSALGMILMLRERVGDENAKIDILNCSPGIRKILKTANFDRLVNVG
ncbi:MAG: STAS domain-containing protein [Syntrophobacteraceae bacterium]|jgi:anti-anti-sigma factor